MKELGSKENIRDSYEWNMDDQRNIIIEPSICV